jgi:2TM domain
MTVDEIARVDRESELRERALLRLKKKRDFHAHLLVYTLVNSCIVLIWFMTGRNGFFWPIFPMAFWGIGVAMNAWDVYRAPDFSEAEIQDEMRKLGQ